MAGKLTEDTKRYVRRHTGLTVDEIRGMDIDELDRHISEYVGCEYPIPIGYVPLFRLSKSEDVDAQLDRV